MWLALLAVACVVDTDPEVDHGPEVPTRAPDETLSVNLSAGSPISADWAHDAFCWTSASDPAFSGNTVVFGRTQPPGADVYLRARPAEDVDVSLWFAQLAPQVTDVPPDIDPADVFSCDAQFVATGNPGQAETLLASGAADLPLVIGVAGADGATVGSFTLEIWGHLPPE